MKTINRLDPITALLVEHIQACAKRDDFARRAIQLLEAGDVEGGMDAADRAGLWDLRAKELEAAGK
jgi:hypothetical protein